MTNERDYELAKKNPSARLEFLKGIDLEDAKPHVRTVSYSDEDCHSLDPERLPIMTSTYDPSSLRFIASLFNTPWKQSLLRSNLIVYPGAFSEKHHPRLDDFISTLIDHEGEHARRLCQNPSEVFAGSINELIGLEGEIEVYRTQIKKMSARNCSDDYIQFVSDNLHMYEEKVKMLESKPLAA